MPEVQIVILAAVIAAVATVAFGKGSVASSHVGKLILLITLCVLPLTVTSTGVAVGIRRSSQTTFCTSCHEMEPYGKSLFVDNPHALAAVHYQKRLIDRDQTCYACHTDYAMFGNAKAKINGLRHVWVHYFGDIPEKPELYAPYPNHNCLHCHDDARTYIEQPAHAAVRDDLAQDKKSCLSCHTLAHDADGVREKNFWVGQ